MYGSHKVILQLNEGSRWFWRAAKDPHGTTANALAINHPGKWKSAVQEKLEDYAVWTRAVTIPAAVAAASVRTQV